MSDVNNNMMRSNRLFKEHKQIEEGRNAIDVQIAQHQADIVRLLDQDRKYADRQAEIAAELVPALTKLGHSVTWNDNRVDYVVRATADGGIVIEETKSWGHLAPAMRPRMFSDATISEAAMFAAANELEDEDAEDDSDPAEWASWTDAITATLPINGRTPTIAMGVSVIDQEAS